LNKLLNSNEELFFFFYFTDLFSCILAEVQIQYNYMPDISNTYIYNQSIINLFIIENSYNILIKPNILFIQYMMQKTMFRNKLNKNPLVTRFTMSNNAYIKLS
jgi:hypothetical protein